MTEEKQNSKQVSQKIKESARQIWLAGLGAYNKAEEDAGKVFEKLVQEGEELEKKTRGVFEKQVKAVEGRVEEVKDRANTTWDKLETVFDQRVSRALHRLGVPTYSEFQQLRKEVEELKAALAEKEKPKRSRKKPE
ncbi:poly(hydroxyalkanoate) granule-associated protein [Hahella sp. CCB-MM4]|uniref:phasin family protein n=1 Tax=Hahella sp. (strain CCB-MM4) TaxID=1926491 RepID=UPI000B9C42CF|nr:phasin family protein [Hahella sp. CCB-MM4]OZG73400.1 poly(hydroxyalkanoate) granule-associated protein [Hahella sp. CCB-MM4]